MAKTVEKDQEAVDQVLRELRSLPDGSLSGEQLLSYIRRLPKPDLPEDWTSAADIRELRGPLPEDDPDFQRFIRRR